MTSEKNSYGEILRSSSIVGGAQATNYVIGLARVKLVAMLLGPTGVGLIGLYTSAIGFVGTVSGLGVGPSSVREIVRAYGQGDPQEAARTVIVLRRVCWAIGFFGWVLAVVFREPISLAMSGSSEHAGAIAVLGAMLLFSAVSGGQLALLQGLRRIGDLARANVTAAALGSIVTVAIYFALGGAGVIPALLAAAFVTLASSFWYARRVPVLPLSVSLRETWSGARRLLGLGLAFMWSAVLVAGLDLLIRAVIARKFGIEGAGIYQAAWALSGMFANFVLSAMGADFYPRLTATIHDRAQAARAVNEQTEIGALLALPGLLAALTLAPLAIKLLYTPQFLPAADLLPWMALGVFGRVISWPMGFVQLALGASRWFAVTETIFIGLWASLAYAMVEAFGIVGAAYAFALVYALYTPAMLWVTWILIDFSWSNGTRKLILASATFVGLAFAARFLSSDSATLVAGIAVTLASALFSLRGLAKRLRENHRLVRWARMVPGGQVLLSGVIPRA
jgi:PST family polysaccharide transporter